MEGIFSSPFCISDTKIGGTLVANGNECDRITLATPMRLAKHPPSKMAADS